MPTCTKSGFTTASNCFGPPNFSQHELNALITYRMAQFYSGVISTYPANPALLWKDANNATCGMSEQQVNVAVFGTMNSTFIGSESFTIGPAETLTKETAAAAIACYKNYSDEQLKKMQLFLLCSILSAFA